MSELHRKRSRESENLSDCTDFREKKRFEGEETDRLRHLLLLENSLAAADECAPNEKVVNKVMRSLEEEIGVTSYPSNFGDDSAPYDKSNGHEGKTLVSDLGIDLIYLLEASDDELGIPLSPLPDLKREICQSSTKTSEGLLDNPDLESLGANWHFDDDFESYQQLDLYENACDASQLQDYMNRDFMSQDLFFEGDFSPAWTIETAGCM